MSSYPKTTARVLVGAAVAAALSGTAFAQAQLEEITVTARKTKENLQDVPLTITAFSAETIERSNIRNVQDVVKYTPGLNYDKGFAPQDTRISIGGLPVVRGKPPVGVLLDGMPGVPASHVVVLGAGVVGTQALKMAVMLGARVTVLDKNVNRLRQLDLVFGKRISSRFASKQNVENAVLDAELVIGSVLVPGASAPKLVSADLVSRMKNGAVVVDVAIDQGGCFETSRPTTHDQPTFEVGGVVHYCVPNMPGTVARTSTFALNSATLPHAVALADKGWQQALKEDRHLRNGLNLAQGQVTYPAVAQALGYPCVSADTLL